MLLAGMHQFVWEAILTNPQALRLCKAAEVEMPTAAEIYTTMAKSAQQGAMEARVHEKCKAEEKQKEAQHQDNITRIINSLDSKTNHQTQLRDIVEVLGTEWLTEKTALCAIQLLEAHGGEVQPVLEVLMDEHGAAK